MRLVDAAQRAAIIPGVIGMKGAVLNIRLGGFQVEGPAMALGLVAGNNRIAQDQVAVLTEQGPAPGGGGIAGNNRFCDGKVRSILDSEGGPGAAGKFAVGLVPEKGAANDGGVTLVTVDAAAINSKVILNQRVGDYGVGVLAGKGAPFGIAFILDENAIPDGGRTIDTIDSAPPGVAVNDGKTVKDRVGIFIGMEIKAAM